MSYCRLRYVLYLLTETEKVVFIFTGALFCSCAKYQYFVGTFPCDWSNWDLLTRH